MTTIAWAKVDQDPSLIPPTSFIADFALPPIFRPRAAIPQLDKQGRFYIPAGPKVPCYSPVVLGSFQATSF